VFAVCVSALPVGSPLCRGGGWEWGRVGWGLVFPLCWRPRARPPPRRAPRGVLDQASPVCRLARAGHDQVAVHCELIMVVVILVRLINRLSAVD